MLAYSFVMGGYPLVHALIGGKNVVLRYTVENATGWSDRKCHPKVTLTSMPFLFDEVCGVPETVRSQLVPGTQIELEGRGTSDGLFYHRIAAVPAVGTD